MRFRLYREYGALNSAPVFDAFEKGLRSLGHESVNSNEEVTVIWSVLWHGRMSSNKLVYDRCIRENKPVIIIEVGNLIRNTTWRISLNHINSLGEFGNLVDLDNARPSKLGVELKPPSEKRRGEILIATQHEKSLQWQGMPSMKSWTEQMISEIRKRTNRRIIVRPHPRSLFPLKMPNILVSQPKKIPNTYDDFDIFYNYHCVINHNSGPAIQAAISGVPIICDASSLAGELSSKLDDIENVQLPDRTDWFLRLCHTEWTVDEIAQGLPLQRLLPKIY
jgi:hypothetical protein